MAWGIIVFMKTTFPTPIEYDLDLEIRPTINAVIAYEDLATGKRAKEICNYFSNHLDGDCEVKYDIWRFDVLADPRLKKIAVLDAVSADIIVIALRGDRDLSIDVKTWIGLWLQQKNRPSDILLALFGHEHEKSSMMASNLRYLRNVAARGNMKFFTQDVELCERNENVYC